MIIMFLRSCCSVWILLTGITAAAVFVEKHEADTVLQRWRRANSGFLEELQQGNLERECAEEVCDYEEAREVFEDEDKTKQFWLTYERRDPCLVNPCHNHGSCVYMGTTYQCFCPDGFGGQYCERAVEDLLKCVYQNGGCEHFCDGSGERHKCFCADGYQLGADGRQCVAQEEFPCGRVAPQETDLNQGVQDLTRQVGTDHCPRGECPWQVLVQLNGRSHCGGVLINPDWVITAAHCIHGNNPQNLTVVAGEHNLDVEEGTEQSIPVSMAIAHEGYVHATADSDVALMRLSQPVTLNRHVVPVCLPTKTLAQRELQPIRYHKVSGWGLRIAGGNEWKDSVNAAPVSPILRKFTVPMIPISQCSPSSAQFNFSSNLLCAGYMEIDHQSCRGDDGSPLVTPYGSTHFLTGVVAFGRGCSPKGIYGVYTNMANYVEWVGGIMKDPPTALTANEKAALDLLEQKHIFLDGRAANQVLTRRRRANSFFEEVKQGDMERECVEERCSLEEAREIFEDKQKTDEFWAKYVDGDACLSQPCAYGGVCKDGIGSYTCFCQSGYQGFDCEIVIPELCENKNGGCEHFCQVHNGNIRCSCTDGYYLASDDKSCHSNETFKCGAIYTEDIRTVFRYQRENVTAENATMVNLTDLNSSTSLNVSISQTLPNEEVFEEYITSQIASMTRIVGGEDCPPGECPWQALLMNEEDRGFCGGTILNEYIILTAAHCMNQSRYIYIKVGEFDMLVDSGNEAIHLVETIISHNRYKPETFLNDIALIKLATPIKFTRFILPACLPESDFAEKVLMKEPEGMVSGFGRLSERREQSTILQRLTVPYVERQICMESTQLRISPLMFCAGYDQEAKDACQGDSGGPHVTRYHNTYFVTGIVSWGEGCARKGKYGIYTQVSKYIRWIRHGINKLVSKKAGGNRLKRHTGLIKRLTL
ncbi:uncharacterized protein LKV04_022126 [Tautogolabrus adspersus]